MKPSDRIIAEAEHMLNVVEFILFRGGLEALARELRHPMPRPDLIVIDGVGYGPDDQLPPPFGRSA